MSEVAVELFLRRRTRLILAVAALAVSVALGAGKPAAEEPSDAAVNAYVKHDYKTALQLLRPLADDGDAQAEFLLGMIYSAGEGVPQSYTAALEFYRLAAKQGHPAAQHDLGTMYQNGQGVPQNFVRAHMWYNIAASTDASTDGRKIVVKHRDAISRLMTSQQIAEAQQMAQRCIASHYVDCGD
jgi:TPR repeat protein